MKPEDISKYHVELPKIVSEKSMMPMTRLLAADMMDNPYKTIGDFFKEMSDADLQSMIEIVESNGDDPRTSEMLLISQMLYTAEGLGTHFDDLDGITKRINALGMFAIITSLDRKGLVKVHYENMSFGDEMGNKVVVERIS